VYRATQKGVPVKTLELSDDKITELQKQGRGLQRRFVNVVDEGKNEKYM
jgi:hypothetical protein